MLIHTSLPAKDPELVSRVICEVAGGERCAFPYPGGYYIGFDDDSSTAVEIYPIDTQLAPGSGPVAYSISILASTRSTRKPPLSTQFTRSGRMSQGNPSTD